MSSANPIALSARNDLAAAHQRAAGRDADAEALNPTEEG